MGEKIGFSTVITTYNRLTFLKRAVESALNQASPCEVVVVDNYSSDGTEGYCRSLGGRIIYHRNPSNLGHSAAMNAGVRLASGDWIKPLDDDDYLAPDCIEETAKAIQKHPSAAICSYQAIKVDETGRQIGRTPAYGSEKVFYIPKEDLHYGMLLELIPFGTTAQWAFNREAFLKSGGWDSNLDVGFDESDSSVKIAQFGDAIFINKYLAFYTVWPGGYSRGVSLKERLKRNILIKQKIYSMVNKKYGLILPPPRAIEDYLKLYWGLIAIRELKFFTGIKIAYRAVLSARAWGLLISVALCRARGCSDKRIQKIPLGLL